MVLYCFLIHAPSSIRVGNEELERVEVFKLLGVHAQRDLKWNTHIDEIVTKASKRLYFLRASQSQLTHRSWTDYVYNKNSSTS